MMKKVLFEMMFQQHPEWKERASHEKAGGNSFQAEGGKGQSRSCVGRMREVCLRTGKKASVDSAEGVGVVGKLRGRSCAP